MIFEGALTHPCPGFAMGKPTMWWLESKEPPDTPSSGEPSLLNPNRVLRFP